MSNEPLVRSLRSEPDREPSSGFFKKLYSTGVCVAKGFSNTGEVYANAIDDSSPFKPSQSMLYLLIGQVWMWTKYTRWPRIEDELLKDNPGINLAEYNKLNNVGQNVYNAITGCAYLSSVGALVSGFNMASFGFLFLQKHSPTCVTAFIAGAINYSARIRPNFIAQSIPPKYLHVALSALVAFACMKSFHANIVSNSRNFGVRTGLKVQKLFDDDGISYEAKFIVLEDRSDKNDATNSENLSFLDRGARFCKKHPGKITIVFAAALIAIQVFKGYRFVSGGLSQFAQYTELNNRMAQETIDKTIDVLAKFWMIPSFMTSLSRADVIYRMFSDDLDTNEIREFISTLFSKKHALHEHHDVPSADSNFTLAQDNWFMAELIFVFGIAGIEVLSSGLGTYVSSMSSLRNLGFNTSPTNLAGKSAVYAVVALLMEADLLYNISFNIIPLFNRIVKKGLEDTSDVAASDRRFNTFDYVSEDGLENNRRIHPKTFGLTRAASLANFHTTSGTPIRSHSDGTRSVTPPPTYGVSTSPTNRFYYPSTPMSAF